LLFPGYDHGNQTADIPAPMDTPYWQPVNDSTGKLFNEVWIYQYNTGNHAGKRKSFSEFHTNQKGGAGSLVFIN
jgi:hypothetical protein